MNTAIPRARVALAGLAALGLILGSAHAAAAQSPAPKEPQAPPRERGSSTAEHGKPIEGRYVVVFKKGVAPQERRSTREDARGRGAQVHFVYEHALGGFAATLPAQALDALRRNPRVDFIEPDSTVTASDVQSPAPWGLDRIDQRPLPLGNSYTYNATGSRTKAYVVDTGIRSTHVEFGGRVLRGYTAIADGRGTEDCNGHGTHVAGTIGGATSGVAKRVTLVAVRVLACDGSGTMSGVIAGVDWVTADHQAGQPAVANMSLGGSASGSLDAAVKNSIADGVAFAVAAGNDNADACLASPARIESAITVGATTSVDARSSFSNHGTCLDIFAPGSSIASTWHTGDTAVRSISGTSMATPHVAGVAALYLQNNPSATPAAVRDAIVSSATPGVVTNAGAGSPDRLVHSLFGTPSTTVPASGCGLPQSYTGTLSGPGDYDHHPNGTYFYAPSGTHQGCVRDAASGTDFDLYLLKWTGSAWATVARSVTTASNEDVTYTGTAGYYLWRVESYSGSGSYTIGIKRP